MAFHIKDIEPKGENLDEDGWSDVGQGTVDWPKMLDALGGTRCTHFVLEHDNPSDIERFCKRSIAYLKKM